MNQIKLIRQTLRPHLSWHGAKVTFLALFLVTLVRVRTVNFVEVAQGWAWLARIVDRPSWSATTATHEQMAALRAMMLAAQG
jgi:hypothetical protein